MDRYGRARLGAETALELDPFRPADRRLHVLVADDDPADRTFVRMMVERMGHTVTCVTSGREAISAAGAGGFDFIIMDMMMPEMDGLEATRSIRKLGNLAGDVPVVALTAEPLIYFRAKYEDAGLTDFLTKPVIPSALRAVLDGVPAPPDPPAAEMEAFDQKRLAMLRGALGDAKVIELFKTFPDNVSERFAAAQSALDANDRLALKHNLHAIKGIAANFGASAVASDAQLVERVVAENGDLAAPFKRMAANVEVALQAAQKIINGIS